MILNANIKPTNENVLESLQKDSVGRNNGVFRFVDFLSRVDGGVSISLDARWGEGKTFFVKQCKMLIDSFNEQKKDFTIEDKRVISELYEKNKSYSLPQKTLCIYYDAWMRDNNTDPLASLICEIASQTDSDYILENNRRFIIIAKEIIEAVIKSNPEINASLPDFSDLPSKYDLIDQTIKENHLQKRINDFITELLGEKYNKLIERQFGAYNIIR